MSPSGCGTCCPEGDLHLHADSPAVDAGSHADALHEDMDEQLRPQGGGYDIGADEVLAPTAYAYLPLTLKNP